MIRNMTAADIDRVMEIWLAATLKSHAFIDEAYWRRNLQAVRDKYLPRSNTILWEEKGQVAGFVSLLDKTYIGGIFVDPALQGKGIGSADFNFAADLADFEPSRLCQKSARGGFLSTPWFQNSDV